MTDRTFPGIRENEKIIIWIHKHWITYFAIFFKAILFGVILVVFLVHYVGKFFQGTELLPFIFLLLILYLLSIWILTYVRWVDEDFDCFILTDERLIDITQNSIFSISISETALDQIQDVDGKTIGFFGNIFSYGMLDVQTAARQGMLKIDHVSQPGNLAQMILNERENFLERRGIRTKRAGSKKTEISD